MSETLPYEANFRTVMGRLPTGVVIVTGGDIDAPSGLVVGSFMSVSLDQSAGHFCAHVLHHEQEPLARTFARSGGDKFAGVPWRHAPSTGAPLLEGVAAWIDCKIHDTIEAGDHWLVLGEVLELGVEATGGALVFHGGAMKSLL
jgi:3-hydroxy-9,10-secoandrosta-1,3,5(10)-triene-9,17-dione monooxygenase reductase component